MYYIHLTPVRMAIIKKNLIQIINATEGVEKREPSYTARGNVKVYSHWEEENGSLLKT